MRTPGSAREGLWETLVAYGAPVSVSALTTLIAYADYGTGYRCLVLFGEFTTNGGKLIATPSHGGVDSCPKGIQQDDALVGGEAICLIEEPNPFTNWQFAAQSDNPGVSTASLRWALLGLQR